MTPKELAELHFEWQWFDQRPYKLGSIQALEYIAYMSRLIWADAYSQPVPF